MKIFSFFALIFFMLASVHCIADEPVVPETKSFIIGVDNTEYYPMYGYENGKYTGFARELLDSFANTEFKEACRSEGGCKKYIKRWKVEQQLKIGDQSP